MNKVIITLGLVFTSFSSLSSQSNSNYKINFTAPDSVVMALFYSANHQEFGILQCLCDPFGKGDGDTKSICSLSSIESTSKKNSADSIVETPALNEFVKYFNNAYINGNVKFEEKNGDKYAQVPFYFNHPGGEKRSNETMNLINRYGNWYLYSF